MRQYSQEPCVRGPALCSCAIRAWRDYAHYPPPPPPPPPTPSGWRPLLAQGNKALGPVMEGRLSAPPFTGRPKHRASPTIALYAYIRIARPTAASSSLRSPAVSAWAGPGAVALARFPAHAAPPDAKP